MRFGLVAATDACAPPKTSISTGVSFDLLASEYPVTVCATDNLWSNKETGFSRLRILVPHRTVSAAGPRQSGESFRCALLHGSTMASWRDCLAAKHAQSCQPLPRKLANQNSRSREEKVQFIRGKLFRKSLWFVC